MPSSVRTSAILYHPSRHMGIEFGIRHSIFIITSKIVNRCSLFGVHSASTYNLAFRYDPMGAKNPSLNLSPERGETFSLSIERINKALKALPFQGRAKPRQHAEVGRGFFARDAAGFSLGYYTGDYRAIGQNGGDFLNADLQNVYSSNSDLFNGNISHMVTAIHQFDQQSGFTPVPQATIYRYDRLNRIKEMNAYQGTVNSGVWTAQTTKTYASSYKYDFNGIKNPSLNLSPERGETLSLSMYHKDKHLYGVKSNTTIPWQGLRNNKVFKEQFQGIADINLH